MKGNGMGLKILFLAAVVGFELSFPWDLIAAHGMSMDGPLKYKPDFTHFEYTNPKAPKGGTLKRSSLGSFDSLNPFVVKGTPAIGLQPLGGGLLHASLMEQSEDEHFAQYGYVAQNVTVAQDRTWIQYDLNPKAQFQDGSPILAEDVEYTFQSLMKEGLPFYKAYYKNVKEVTVLSPRSIRFSFKDGTDRELPMILGQLPVLSKKYFTRVGFGKGTLSPPLGSGPYRIGEVKPGQSIEYNRVKNWWGENLPSQKGRYNFDQIHFDYFRDDQVAFEAFKAGVYDVRQVVSADEWFREYTFDAVNDGRVKRESLKHSIPLGFMGLGMNLRKAPFNSPEVREALILAFDFEWINKNIFYNAYHRTQSFFENSDLSVKSRSVPVSDGSGYNRSNLLKAQAILKKAGWKIHNGRLIHPHHGPFVLEILIQTPTYQRVLLNYARNLERLGIEAKIKLTDSSLYEKRMNDYQYDMTVMAIPQSNSPGTEQREYWSSKSARTPGSRNYMGISDPKIDRLVEEIIDAKNREGLVQKTKELDLLLMKGNYAIPGWYSNIFRLAYWDKFKRPKISPKYGIGIENWWMTLAP